ncbi:translation initiation factor IF-2 N-terminal domain-containing protein [Prochlorococcus sp. AH-736-L23]|nr:translation initiation factor IF-2 N-terminal domain-containing protein [Prochlorococcus sp. AH-736-L23]
MVSITSNKLVELNKDNLSKVIEEVISCQQIITDELVNDIEIYQELKNSKHKKQFAVKNLMRTLDTINQSIGWQAFIQLFNITKDDEENIFFTDVLPLLNKTHLPALPWGTAPKCWLIKEDSEDRIVHSTQQNVTIPNNEFLGNITPLIPFDAEVTKRIQTGVGRSRDIMLLYLNLCIAECIEKPAFIQKGDPGNLEKELIADPEIDGKSLKEYVKVLLKKYFQQNANRLNKEKIFPELIDPQDNLWESLLNESTKLRNEIILIKEKYLEIISGYKFEEKFSVFNDIWSFLVKNNLSEVVPPSISLLQSEQYKAYGLVKKISKGPGMATVRKEYTPWIINQKTDSKNTKIDGITIYELAKRLNLNNQFILDAANELGISIKSHTSIISNTTKDKIIEKLIEQLKLKTSRET